MCIARLSVVYGASAFIHDVDEAVNRLVAFDAVDRRAEDAFGARIDHIAFMKPSVSPRSRARLTRDISAWSR